MIACGGRTLMPGMVEWRQLPSDFPPWPTVHGYFRNWRMAGVWVLLHRALYPLARLAAGRKPEPTLAIMDGQSVKTTERGGVRGGRPFEPSLLMLGTRAASLLGSCGTTGGTCRSSSANSDHSRSRVSPGLLSAASHGLGSIAASPRIMNAMSRHQKRCCRNKRDAKSVNNHTSRPFGTTANQSDPLEITCRISVTETLNQPLTWLQTTSASNSNSRFANLGQRRYAGCPR